jgi:hypothetical protein
MYVCESVPSITQSDRHTFFNRRTLFQNAQPQPTFMKSYASSHCIVNPAGSLLNNQRLFRTLTFESGFLYSSNKAHKFFPISNDLFTSFRNTSTLFLYRFNGDFSITPSFERICTYNPSCLLFSSESTSLLNLPARLNNSSLLILQVSPLRSIL